MWRPTNAESVSKRSAVVYDERESGARLARRVMLRSTDSHRSATRSSWSASVVVVHLIEGNIVSPLVMSKKVDLPPVLTIMSLLVIGQLLRPLGLIVALPILAALMVIVRRILITRVFEGQGLVRRRESGRWFCESRFPAVV